MLVASTTVLRNSRLVLMFLKLLMMLNGELTLMDYVMNLTKFNGDKVMRWTVFESNF